MDITGANNSVSRGLLDALHDLGGRDPGAGPGADAAPERAVHEAPPEAVEAPARADPGETLLRLPVWAPGEARLLAEPSVAVPAGAGADALARYVAGPLSGEA